MSCQARRMRLSKVIDDIEQRKRSAFIESFKDIKIVSRLFLLNYRLAVSPS
jgi:hypothetical protein